ncbi:MAG: hypothetical protein AAGE98_15290 [Actinomycetota bacterium]
MHERMTRRALAALLALAATAGACSGGDDDAAPVNTVAPESSASSPSTTTSSSTSSTTSTTTTTTPPTTTVAEESTDDDETSTTSPATARNEEEESALIAAVERYFSVFWSSNGDEVIDPSVWEGVVTPERAAVMVDRAQERVEQGLGYQAIDPDLPHVLAHEVQFVVGENAQVKTCMRDQASVFDLGTGEVVRVAEVISAMTFDLEALGSEWVVNAVSTTQNYELTQVSECADSL